MTSINYSYGLVLSHWSSGYPTFSLPKNKPGERVLQRQLYATELTRESIVTNLARIISENIREVKPSHIPDKDWKTESEKMTKDSAGASLLADKLIKRLVYTDTAGDLAFSISVRAETHKQRRVPAFELTVDRFIPGELMPENILQETIDPDKCTRPRRC